MRRRQFLASGAAVLSIAAGGCVHPPVVLDLEEATSEEIADERSLRAEPGSEEYAVVVSALEEGSATRRGRSELFDRRDTVRVEGAVYRVSEVPIESRDVTVYDVRIDFDPANGSARLGQIEYDDLPAVDRQRLGRIVTEEDPPDQEGYDIGVSYGTAEEVGNESVFVPDPQYDIVRYDGNRYRVAVESRTTSETEYRYEVTEVAPDLETFANQIREAYLFTLAGLSDAEREVLEEAIEGGYFEDSDAFRSVIDRLRAREGLNVEDSYGTWLLSYESVEYLAYAEW